MFYDIGTVQQNKVIESKITRRLSRIVLKKKKSADLISGKQTAAGLQPQTELSAAAASMGYSSMLGTSLSLFPSSLGPSSSHGPPQFLRITIADTADAGHIWTTIQAFVSSPS